MRLRDLRRETIVLRVEALTDVEEAGQREGALADLAELGGGDPPSRNRVDDVGELGIVVLQEEAHAYRVPRAARWQVRVHVVAAGRARRVADPHLLAVLGALPRVVHRDLEALDRGEQLLATKGLGRARRALREDVAEAAAVSDRIGGRDQRADAAELERDSVGLGVRGDPAPAEIHRPRDRRTERDRVHAERLAALVRFGDRGEIADAAVRSHRRDGFEFRSAVLWIDLVRLLKAHDLLAAHRARPAGFHLDAIALLDERLGTDVRSPGERTTLVVADGHPADLRVPIETHARPEVMERPVVLLKRVRDPPPDLLHLRRVGERHVLRAFHHDRLQLLRAHDGAESRASGDVLAVVDDPGAPHAVP